MWVFDDNFNLGHSSIGITSYPAKQGFFASRDGLQVIRCKQLHYWKCVIIVNFKRHFDGCTLICTVNAESRITGPNLHAVSSRRQVTDRPIGRPSGTAWLIEQIVVIVWTFNLKPNALDVATENPGVCIRCTTLEVNDSIVNLRTRGRSVDPNGRRLCIQLDCSS